MLLKILGSNSSGNCYLLQASSGQTLIVECGVHISKIKYELNYNVKKVVAGIISHGHQDHCSAAASVMGCGIDVYASAGTIEEMGLPSNHRLKTIKAHESFLVGEFEILPFDVQHDAKEPLGFIIHHPESGNILFLTDSYYSKYLFEGIDNVLIESNFCEDIIDEKIASGAGHFVRNRVLSSHLSIQSCKELLSKNDLSTVNNIVLLHLSNANSDSRRFKREVEELTGKTVYVASPGLQIDLNKQPF